VQVVVDTVSCGGRHKCVAAWRYDKVKKGHALLCLSPTRRPHAHLPAPPTLHHRIVPIHQRPANGAPFVYYCTELFHAGDSDSGSDSGGNGADGDDVDLDRVCAFVELVLDALDVQQVLYLGPSRAI